MTKEDFDFIETTILQKEFIVNALKINMKKAKCRQCGCDLYIHNVGVFPPLDIGSKYTLVCDSPLCLSEYFTDFERMDAPVCAQCGELMKEVEDSVSGKKNGHIFACECTPNLRVSVG